LPLTEPQQTIVDNSKRFSAIIAGRRFGKSYLAIRQLAWHARNPNSRCWYVAPTRQQGKGIAWNALKERLGKLNWISKINESELAITLVNGSVIEIRSADAYDRMRGFAVNFVVFDEFADMDPDVWTAVRPTLSDTEGSAMFIGTPKGYNNWAKSIYDRAKNNEDWCSWQFSTADGGQVSEEELERARNEMDERLFRQEYLATWETMSGRIAYAFNDANIVSLGDIPDRAILHVGMDFNIDPACAAVAVQTGTGQYHFFDEIEIYGGNTDEMVQELKNRYPTNKIFVYPDASGAQRKTSAGGRTDHTILTNAGFTLKCGKANPPVRDRINSANAAFCSTDGTRRVFVDPACKQLIKCLESHTYKPGTQIPNKDTGYDHFFDAATYLINTVLPIRRNAVPLSTKRWTVNTF